MLSSGLLRHAAAFGYVPTFQRNILPESSDLKVKAVCSSEMLLPPYKSTRRQNSEDQLRHLHALRTSEKITFY
jgi:hypothetical protein